MSEINAKINEAEVYQSMGLLEASLDIYHLLSGSQIQDSQKAQEIQNRIASLRSRLQELDKEGVGNVSPRELSILQGSPAEETTETLIESAGALRELGLVKESAAEYEKAFRKSPFSENLLTRFMDCLFLFRSPGQVAEYLCPLVDQLNIEIPEKARLISGMGLDMEKRGHKDPAIELYKAALMMNPGVSEVEQRLNALMAQMLPGSRYDYLIQENMVTPGHLQKALVISQKTRKSVEHVLIEEFHLKKSDIGKSLSCRLRLSQSNYLDKDSVGSGWDKIDASTRSEIKLMLTARF